MSIFFRKNNLAGTRNKPNREKITAILKLTPPDSSNEFRSFLGAIQYIAKSIQNFWKKTDRMRELLPKKTEWKWTKREEEDFNGEKKLIADMQCLAPFARNRENTVTTDASRAGRGKTLWQKRLDYTIRTTAFASRYLNDTAKNYSPGEIDLIAVIWRLEKFRSYFYGKVVYLHTDY